MIYKSSLYNKVRETGAHVVGIINDITIDKGDRNIDKKTAPLNKVLEVSYDWTQERHTEFGYDDKLGLLNVHKSKLRRPKKRKLRSKKAYTTDCRPTQTTNLEEFGVARSPVWYHKLISEWKDEIQKV